MRAQWNDDEDSAGFTDDLNFDSVEPPTANRRNWAGWILGGLAAMVVVALVTAVGAIFSASSPVPANVAASSTVTVDPQDTAQSPSEEPSESETPSPSPSVVPSSSAVPSRSTPPAVKSSIVPSKRPVTEPVAPAPAAPVATANCPTNPGPVATKVQIRVELTAAATHVYWQTSAPKLRVPLSLLKAVAWQESGWQSSIVSCDGGIGVMQVMPNTATWINNRFGTSWSATTVNGNVLLGGEYLAWLIRYMGDVYYGGAYDVTADEGLLNAVIAGYNVGAGDVDPTQGDSGIPNWSYVNNVRALMVTCPCSAF